MHVMYDELADWWPLLSAPEDYAEEAAIYQRALLTHARRPLRTLLELGSGGGNNASHLKARFTMTLVEPSAGMLAVSRRLNPECEHVQGDMRSVRLERRFDAIFIHDAVCYMTSEHDLRAAIATAFIHCEPGGVALFVPDHVRENFTPASKHGGHDASDGRGLRYLSWVVDPDPTDTHYVVDYAFLLRDVSGAVRSAHERHLEGLFTRQNWLDWLGEAGFEPASHRVDHSGLPSGEYEAFIARKPALRTTHE
jgi:trans-aconitate methyltransferase